MNKKNPVKLEHQRSPLGWISRNPPLGSNSTGHEKWHHQEFEEPWRMTKIKDVFFNQHLRKMVDLVEFLLMFV